MKVSTYLTGQELKNAKWSAESAPPAAKPQGIRKKYSFLNSAPEAHRKAKRPFYKPSEK